MQYDRKTTNGHIIPGDQVALETVNRNKLDPWYNGPYKVIGVDGPNITIVDNGKNRQFTKIELLSMFIFKSYFSAMVYK